MYALLYFPAESAETYGITLEFGKEEHFADGARLQCITILWGL